MKNILLITEAWPGSDEFNLTYCLIKTLTQQFPDLKIDWQLIDWKDDQLLAQINLDKEIKASSWKTSSPFSTDITNNKDLILVFPGNSFLSETNFIRLKNTSVPFLQLYDCDLPSTYDKNRYKSEVPCLKAGFKGLGLLLPTQALQEIIPNDFALDPQKQLFISRSSWNQDFKNDTSFSVFFDIVTSIADPLKSVEIATDTNYVNLNSTLNHIAWEHGFSEVSYYARDKDGHLKEVLNCKTPSANCTPRTLRLIADKDLHPAQWNYLMRLAQSLQQTTGIKQLGEALALQEGVFPFYQLPPQQNTDYQDWLELARLILGKDAAYVRLLSLIGPGEKLDSKEFIKIWQNAHHEILANALTLRERLKRFKNLEVTLPKLLVNFIYLYKLRNKQYIKHYAELVVQLLTNEILQTSIDKIYDVLETIKHNNKSICIALTVFLRTNIHPINEQIILNLLNQLKGIDSKSVTILASNAARLLNHCEYLTTDDFSKIIPLLQNASIDQQENTIKHLAETKVNNFDSISIALNISKAKEYKCTKYSYRFITWPNKILLAVDVYEDGIGDIIKFISIYKQISQAFPSFKIESLIACTNNNIATILKILRENEIPIKNVHIIEVTVYKFQGLPYNKPITATDLTKSGLRYGDGYALIMSIDTPMPIINECIRTKHLENIPFIQLSEVNYCSSDPHGEIAHDPQHHLVSMGADAESVGYEVLSLPAALPLEAIEKLSLGLKQRILDKESPSCFLANTFFMPCYLEEKQGLFSIWFTTIILKHQLQQKQNAVLWLNMLPEEVESDEFKETLREQGFANLIIDDGKNKKIISLNVQLSKKYFKLVIGRINSKDYNLLHYIARDTGGMIACKGLNSFEISLSYDVLPIFDSRQFLLPLLHECQAIASEILEEQSVEYQSLQAYIQLLITISYIQYEKSRLEEISELLPFRERLKRSNDKQLFKDVKTIQSFLPQLAQVIIEEHLVDTPVDMIASFFQIHSLETLISAWKKVASYIREYKNLNQWLIQTLNLYLTNKQSIAKYDQHDNLNWIAVERCQTSIVTKENLPAIYDCLNEIFTNRKLADDTLFVQWVLSDSPDYFVNIATINNKLSLVISASALQKLNRDEILFALELAAQRYEKLPVENGVHSASLELKALELNKFSSLESGINYAMKLISFLKSSPNRKLDMAYYQFDGIDFYSSLIKLFKFELGRKGRYTLFLPPQATSSDECLSQHIISEIQQQIDGWNKLKSIPTDNICAELTAHIAQHRIKYSDEYERPSHTARNLIEKINDIPVTEYVEMEKLVDASYTNRLAQFTEIYRIVCQRKYGFIKPISIFQELAKLLSDFSQSANFTEARVSAQGIIDFLEKKETKYLFNNYKNYHSHAVTLFGTALKNSLIDEVLVSSIGAEINWDACLNWNSKIDLSTRLAWADADDSAAVAKTLFLLGHTGIPSIWQKVPSNLIESIRSNTCSLLSTAASFTEFLQYRTETVKPSLNRHFYTRFLTLTNATIIFPPSDEVDSQILEKFIADNFTALSLTHLTPDASVKLCRLFNKFLLIDKQNAEKFIRQFYFDTSFKYGIYRLEKHKSELTHESFFECCDDQNRSCPYLDFLLESMFDYGSLSELTEMYENIFFDTEYKPLFKHLLFKLKFDAKNPLALETLYQQLLELSKFNNRNCSISILFERLYAFACMNSIKFQDKMHIFDINSYKYLCAVSKSQDIFDIFRSFWEVNDNFSNELQSDTTAKNLSAEQFLDLYILFDTYIAFPNTPIREIFSRILRDKLAALSSTQRIPLIEKLLSRNLPCNDTVLIDVLSPQWVKANVDYLGKDDGSYSYFIRIQSVANNILNNISPSYRYHLLDEILKNVNAQQSICKYVSNQLQQFDCDDAKYIHAMLKQECFADLAHELVEFISQEMTAESLNKFITLLNTKHKAWIFSNKQYFSNNAPEMLSIYIYHNFWSVSLEKRAVIIDSILMPSNKLESEQAAAAAYTNSFQFICKQIFSPSEDTQLYRALLESFLNTANKFTRPYLLTAVIAANKLSGHQNKDIYDVLPKLAEALGGAGTKVGQAGHSWYNAEPKLAACLEYLKSQTRIPYRWELLDLIQRVLPKTLFDQITHIGKLLGGASFYLVVEVTINDGRILALRIRRDNAEKEADYGFAHIHKAVENCKHPKLSPIQDDLDAVIAEATQSAKNEMKDEVAKQQYIIAESIYRNVHHTVTLNNINYNVTINPVRLHDCGPSYQLIDKAEGIEFIDLKKDKNLHDLCQAVAFSVCNTELDNMLSGDPFDPDRHAGQSRVAIIKINDHQYDVQVTHYDFGEIATTQPTQAELKHCEAFKKELYAELTHFQYILKWMLGRRSSLQEVISQKLVDYLKQHRDCPTEDMRRLRSIFKGILALNDYFDVLKDNKDLLFKLHNRQNTRQHDFWSQRIKISEPKAPGLKM